MEPGHLDGETKGQGTTDSPHFLFYQHLVFRKGFKHHEEKEILISCHLIIILSTSYVLGPGHCAVFWATHPCLGDTDSCNRAPTMPQGCTTGHLSVMAAINWGFTIYQTLVKTSGVMEASYILISRGWIKKMYTHTHTGILLNHRKE